MNFSFGVFLVEYRMVGVALKYLYLFSINAEILLLTLLNT